MTSDKEDNVSVKGKKLRGTGFMLLIPVKRMTNAYSEKEKNL
jgi:hypothetical protein